MDEDEISAARQVFNFYFENKRYHNPLADYDFRVKIDSRKWIASKLKPKTYGERLDLSVTQEPISILAALEAAQRRVFDDKRTIEAPYSRTPKRLKLKLVV